MGYVPPIIPPNQPVADPGLADLMRAVQQNVAINTNCHAVATIKSFTRGMITTTLDGSTQTIPNGLYTVSADINYSRTYFNRLEDGTYQAQQVSYPLLIDCPAIILGGGTTYLQFPIQVGDQCLILFNDRDLNNWFAGTRSGPVASARTHSLADAIALVGFGAGNQLDLTRALLTNGNAAVGMQLDGGLVRIANNMTTLATVLSQLITAIENITVSAGTFMAPSGGGPVTGVSGTVSNTSDLESAKTAIQGLLE